MSEVNTYIAGNISNKLEAWQQLTSDPFILDIVKHGLKLNFVENPILRGPFEPGMNTHAKHIISNEISILLEKGVIKKVDTTHDVFYSHLFTRPKKEGTHRTILNLKPLNKICATFHFKMENLKNAFSLIKKDSFLASIDLKDAFYSVAIYDDHQKYLYFMHDGISYHFQCMPNGYLDAMRVFTKLLKPVFAYLRELGYLSVIYVDDTLLVGDNYDECLKNVHATIHILEKLGFTIHPRKSVFVPTKSLTFLGFNFDTSNMTLSLSNEKMECIYKLATLLENKSVSIRTVARLLGKISSVFEAVPQGRLHFRGLELDKIKALQKAKGDFESSCHISQEGFNDIAWWKHNIFNAIRDITQHPIDYTITTDASGEGWGASDSKVTINGRWSESEKLSHINYLEMKAIFLSLKSLLPQQDSKHVRVFTDNITALTYINKKGGTVSKQCNEMAVAIWEVCLEYNTHITAAHIPGKHNTLADTASRKFDDAKEWMLDPKYFLQLCSHWGTPIVDLFASRLNKQTPNYISFQPDPDSFHIDAFTLRWDFNLCYAFPPFSLIHPILRKIRADKARVLLIVPDWPTQSWWPVFKKMSRESISVSINSKHLNLPGCPSQRHPLWPKLHLTAALVHGS